MLQDLLETSKDGEGGAALRKEKKVTSVTNAAVDMIFVPLFSFQG